VNDGRRGGLLQALDNDGRVQVGRIVAAGFEPKGQRPQPHHPGPPDIQRMDEVSLRRLRDLPLCGGDRATESGRGFMGRQGRFKDDQLLQRHPLA
jgi:hypothetical protein